MTGWRRFGCLDPVALVGLLLAAGVWVFGMATMPLSGPFQSLYHIEPIGEIRGDQTAGQTFVPLYSGLKEIDVALADYGHPNTGPVYFRLKTSQGGTVLYEQSLRAEEIHGDVTYHFQFPAIADSAGRQYYFELAAPNATIGNSITAYVQPSGGYPDGEAYFVGRPIPGDLVFSMSFKVNGWNRARIWLQQATAAKPGVWGQPWLYGLLVAAYVALAGALIWILRPTVAA